MEIRKVAVIGAGTMGAGIAQVCCESGLETTLFDKFPEGLEFGMKRINEFWDKGISKGKTKPEQKETWLSLLKTSTDLSVAVSDTDLVIEAVPEIIDLKIEIFKSLDEFTPPKCILATNTSSLSISKIARSTKNPKRVIGLHFFNPVPLMKLLEIIKHDLISNDTIDVANKLARMMGKTPILVKDSPGFATSRLGVVLGNEAIKMLSEGVASASDIDSAMHLGYRHPMGPLELSDLVGLDVRRDILLGLAEATGDSSYLPHPLLESLVKNGDLGKKTNKGIYNWSNGIKSEREDLLFKLRKQ
jgi:3-hydroxybutyryl-CoA dehydrogenase